MKRKLNLGCGTNKLEDYINIDKSNKYNPDLAIDIEKGLPFADNSIDKIYARHILEHFDNLIFVMNECWRVLRAGGILEIIVPNGKYIEWAMRDPTHKRIIVKDTFLYFSNHSLIPEYDEIKCNFKIIKIEETFKGKNKDIEAILQK